MTQIRCTQAGRQHEITYVADTHVGHVLVVVVLLLQVSNEVFDWNTECNTVEEAPDSGTGRPGPEAP